MFAFPIKNDRAGTSNLFNLYKTFMVISVISAALVICQTTQIVRRIQIANRELGDALRKQGYVILFSNVVSAVFYYLLGQRIIVFGSMIFPLCVITLLLFLTCTEVLPLYVFI